MSISPCLNFELYTVVFPFAGYPATSSPTSYPFYDPLRSLILFMYHERYDLEPYDPYDFTSRCQQLPWHLFRI